MDRRAIELRGEQALANERRMMVRSAMELALAGFHPQPHEAAELLELQRQLAELANPRDTAYIGLGLIEQLGITFASDDPERAVEALGLVLVYAAVMARNENLGIAPIIVIADKFRRRFDVEPIRASGMIAAIAMRRPPLAIDPRPVMDTEQIRLATVEALAFAIAKAIDDVELSHEVMIKPEELFSVIAREVLAGQRGDRFPAVISDAAIDPPAPAIAIAARGHDGTTSEHRVAEVAEAAAQLQTAAGVLLDVEATEPGDFDIATDDVPTLASTKELQRRALDAFTMSGMSDLRRELVSDPGNPGDPTWNVPPDHRLETDEELRVRVRGVIAQPSFALGAIDREAAEMQAMADVRQAEFDAHGYAKPHPVDPSKLTGLADFTPWTDAIPGRVAPGAAVVSIPPRHAMTQHVRNYANEYMQQPVPGLAEDRICPQCASPMSHRADTDLWVCSQGHEHTTMHLAALRGNALPAKPRHPRPPVPTQDERTAQRSADREQRIRFPPPPQRKK